MKLLRIDPLRRLSLQRHTYRMEHWVVLKGVVRVEIDSEILDLTHGQHVAIATGAWHRLHNISETEDALIAEVQVGGYTSPSEMEKDIMRSEDDYGRA